MKITIFLLLVLPACRAANLSVAAEQAWQIYTAQVEERIARQHTQRDTYLAALHGDPAERAGIASQLSSGVVSVVSLNGPDALPGALLHHWRATAFVPQATPEEMLHLLRDYDHLSQYYAPVVTASHLIAKDGPAALVAMRMNEKKIITVVLDCEFRIENGLAGFDRGYEFSRSTHIRQVDYPGTAREHLRPERDGDGLLWRLNSYWSFIEWRNGLVIECESISLTRDIPAGLNWLVAPLVRDLPRESLEFTIRATAKALQAQNTEGAKR